jgi:hypothetical protein
MLIHSTPKGAEMSSNFKMYQNAAQDVQSGWMQGNYYDGDGNKCLVKGVMNAMGMGRYETVLPEAQISQIDRQLKRYPSYRMLRLAARWQGGGVQGAIMSWNDLPWRRKRSVVRVLNSIAVSFLFDEVSQLKIQLAHAQEENRQLQEQIAKLTRENEHLLKRLRNRSALRDLKASAELTQTHVDEIERELQEMLEAEQQRLQLK